LLCASWFFFLLFGGRLTADKTNLWTFLWNFQLSGFGLTLKAKRVAKLRSRKLTADLFFCVDAVEEDAAARSNHPRVSGLLVLGDRHLQVSRNWESGRFEITFN
jgi:hypothetical protein